MSQICRKNFDGEYVKTGKGNCYQHFSNYKANCRQHVALDELREDAENSAADHADEKCFFASDFVHEVVGDKVARDFDETNNLWKFKNLLVIWGRD